MRTTNKKNKIKATELLDTYSVDSIIDLFKDINIRISSLINSSADDFLNLHSNFIKTHEQIKQIIITASDILNSFNDDGNILFINESSGEINELKNSVYRQIRIVNESHKSLDDISRILDYMYIPVNNYIQNLKTFKLISANLKLDSDTIKYSNELNIVIENILIKYPDLVKSLKILKTLIDETRKTFEKLDKNYFRSVIELCDYILGFGQFLLQKHHQAQKLKVKLKEKVDLSIENTSKIITHLQYQDIVKQKIEHIQQTHFDILEKLSLLIKNEDHPDFILSKAKLLIQIRDIAGLQAAQLIHANSEYQNAIEVITTRFIGLGEVLEEIAQICKQFCMVGKSENIYLNDTPEISSGKASSLSDELNTLISILNLKIDTIHHKTHEFSDICDDLKNFGSLFSNLVVDIMDSSVKEKSSGIVSQINEVSKEFLKSIKQIESFSRQNNLLSDNLRKYIEDNMNKDSLEQKVKNQCKKIIAITNDFSRKKSSAFNKFNSHIEHCEIADDLKESIQKVRYYEMFENEIETIIRNLDNISRKLHIEDENIIKHDRKTLDSIKKRYTIKSEFLVHERISNEVMKGNFEMFENELKDLSQKIDEEDENLELF